MNFLRQAEFEVRATIAFCIILVGYVICASGERMCAFGAWLVDANNLDSNV